MRSRCRSLLLPLLIVSAVNALQIGAAPCFSFLEILQAQAKGGADSATAGDGDSPSNNAGSNDGAAGGKTKCGPGGGPPVGPPGGPGSPRGHRFPGGFGGEGGFGRMPLDFSMLNLTDDQKSKIKTIRGRNVARAKEIRQSIGAKGGEFRDLMFSEAATNDQIMAKRDELRALKDELDNLRLNDFLAIRTVFTAEQRKKLAESKPPDPKGPGRGGGPGDADPDRPDRPDKPDRSDKNPSTSVKVK